MSPPSHVYLKNAADVAAHDRSLADGVAQGRAGTARPSSPSWSQPNALVEMAIVAIPNGGERVVIMPTGWSTANPYSYAIRSGDTLFMSGMISRGTKDNTPIEGDIAAQTKTVMANAGELLKAAGFGFEHVVASRVYITDQRRTSRR